MTNHTDPRSVLSDATAALILERGKTHGDFTDHARITQNLKGMMSSEDRYLFLNACQRESLEMIAHKIGRIIAGDPDFRDHWMDISGYAMLVAERCSK
jgi:Domain of unknown function (DUF6378)